MTISNRRASCVDALSLSNECSPSLDVIAPQLNGELAVIPLGPREHGRQKSTVDHLLLPGALALQPEFHCRIGVIRKNVVNSQPSL